MKHIKSIIKGNPTFKKEIPKHENYLEVAEFFYDTIQGEGINLGQPAAFFRVQHCTQNCVWCDTQEVWRYGNPYTFAELMELMEKTSVIEQLRLGQHLILTGGSPLKQQDRLSQFLYEFMAEYGFKPIIEIENECTLMPNSEMIELVDVWNNSPKLSHSGNLDILRYQPSVLRFLSGLENSWFKFVVSGDEDWREIKQDFLDKRLIFREQIILMPLGATRAELHKNRDKVVDIAVRESVRYCSREHVELWDRMTGV